MGLLFKVTCIDGTFKERSQRIWILTNVVTTTLIWLLLFRIVGFYLKMFLSYEHLGKIILYNCQESCKSLLFCCL